jgi:hypothetical protein
MEAHAFPLTSVKASSLTNLTLVDAAAAMVQVKLRLADPPRPSLTVAVTL